MPEYRWHILGAGAIGCLFAEQLYDAGCDTTLLLRAGSGTQRLSIERAGVRRELALPCTDPDHCGPISHLLVTTKAYDVHSAVAGIADALEPGAVVVLLVNGLGIADALRADVHGIDIACGTTTAGAWRRARYAVCHAGSGQTRIGQQDCATPPDWFRPWRRGGADCVWDADIDTALWTKLAVNCVINPLTAVHRCRNGELAVRGELREQVALLCREVAAVSRAAGHTRTARTLAQTVEQVVADTAANRSSMLQDVLAGRRTEIDYINGYLLRVAREHGIETPRNAALLEEVKRLGH